MPVDTDFTSIKTNKLAKAVTDVKVSKEIAATNTLKDALWKINTDVSIHGINYVVIKENKKYFIIN